MGNAASWRSMGSNYGREQEGKEEMKKFIIAFLVVSGLAIAQVPIPLPNGMVGGPTTPSTCVVNSSVNFWNWTESQWYQCTSQGYRPFVVYHAVTVLPPATTAQANRIYKISAATTANVCPDAGDSGGTAVAWCISNGTHYQALNMSDSANGGFTQISGAMVVVTTGGQPTCDSSHRFWYWTTTSGAGVKDAVQVCTKDAADAYAWRTIY